MKMTKYIHSTKGYILHSQLMKTVWKNIALSFWNFIISKVVWYLHHEHLLKFLEWINLLCFGADDLTIVFNSHLLQGLKQYEVVMRTQNTLLAYSEIQSTNLHVK